MTSGCMNVTLQEWLDDYIHIIQCYYNLPNWMKQSGSLNYFRRTSVRSSISMYLVHDNKEENSCVAWLLERLITTILHGGVFHHDILDGLQRIYVQAMVQSRHSATS